MLSHVQLFATPWTIASQAPLSMEFSRQEHWNGLPFSTPRGSSQPRGQTFCLLHILHWQADSLLSSPPGIAASGPDHVTSIKRKEQKIAYFSNTRHF